jgi:hypothetical protein
MLFTYFEDDVVCIIMSNGYRFVISPADEYKGFVTQEGKRKDQLEERKRQPEAKGKSPEKPSDGLR